MPLLNLLLKVQTEGAFLVDTRRQSQVLGLVIDRRSEVDHAVAELVPSRAQRPRALHRGLAVTGPEVPRRIAETEIAADDVRCSL
jgi:hypothetical protein